MSALKPCPSCDGTGVDLYDGGVSRSCQVCHGRGTLTEPSAPSTASALSDARDAAFEESAPIRAALAPSPAGVEVVAWLGEGDGFKSFTRKKSIAAGWVKSHLHVTAVVPAASLDQATRRAEEAEAHLRNHLVFVFTQDEMRDVQGQLSAAEARCSALEQALAKLRRAGGQMSNICFNLYQQVEGYKLTGRDAQSMNVARIEWDEALSSTARSLTSKQEMNSDA